MDPTDCGPFAYVLTEDELTFLLQRTTQRWRASQEQLTWTPTIVALAVILSASLGLAIGGVVSPHSSQVALMFGVASYFAGFWLHHWQLERAADKARADWRNRELASGIQRTIVIDATGVGADRQSIKARYGWDNFTAIEESGGLVILWASHNQAVVVPTRAFPDPAQHAAFLALARAKIAPVKA
jgi:YcxB-like protein